MRPITARVAAELNQADRSVPVAVRIAGTAPIRRPSARSLLRGRDGALTPLSSVAKITTELARSLIDHQDGLRRQIVVASPKGADQAGFADAARKAVAAKVRCRRACICAMAARPRRRRPPRTSCCCTPRPPSC
jgi:Cu/Ag efflux pump CusA